MRTAQLPSKKGTSPEQTSALEDSILKISGQLSTIWRNQKYFRTRENRNFSTVNSTEKRIVNFSMIQIGLIVCMGALQVFVVRFFFQVCNCWTVLSQEDIFSLHLLFFILLYFYFFADGDAVGQGARKGYV